MKNEVDKYLEAYSREDRIKLDRLREIIKEEIPEAEESISYMMPAYKIKGKPVCYFAGQKKHIGFYPTPEPIEHFKEELAIYKTSKGAIQLPKDKELPEELIRKIIRHRISRIR